MGFICEVVKWLEYLSRSHYHQTFNDLDHFPQKSSPMVIFCGAFDKWGNYRILYWHFPSINQRIFLVTSRGIFFSPRIGFAFCPQRENMYSHCRMLNIRHVAKWPPRPHCFILWNTYSVYSYFITMGFFTADKSCLWTYIRMEIIWANYNYV